MLADKFCRYVSGREMWATSMYPALDGRVRRFVRPTDLLVTRCDAFLLEGVNTGGPCIWFGVWEEMKQEGDTFVSAGRWITCHNSLKDLGLPSLFSVSTTDPTVARQA